MMKYVCFCLIVSFVYLNANGVCLYWIFSNSPEKHNPCGDDMEFVPDNAEAIFISE